jgi:hypothetical protein
MKRRSLFKKFVGGLAAAVGVRALPVVPKPVVMQPYHVAVDWGRDFHNRGASNPLFAGGFVDVDVHAVMVLKTRQLGRSEIRDQMMKLLEQRGQA